MNAHSLFCGGDEDTGSNSNDRGTYNTQQSTKSSNGNGDINGNNNNIDENKGNGIIDGSAVAVVAEGQRRWKCSSAGAAGGGSALFIQICH